MNFKNFVETSENKKINEVIKKIPKGHSNLIKQYKIKILDSSTLPDDNKSIGELDNKNKTIKVASPWFYGKEHVLLHEIGHKVWENILSSDHKEEWKKILRNTKNKEKQNAEELFCQAYVQYYCSNKLKKYDYETWDNFIKNLPRST